MKRLRRTSNSLSTGSNGSNNGVKKSLNSRDASPNSVSPDIESLRNSTSSINEENINTSQSSANELGENLNPKKIAKQYHLQNDENCQVLSQNDSAESTTIINKVSCKANAVTLTIPLYALQRHQQETSKKKSMTSETSLLPPSVDAIVLPSIENTKMNDNGAESNY